MVPISLMAWIKAGIPAAEAGRGCAGLGIPPPWPAAVPVPWEPWAPFDWEVPDSARVPVLPESLFSSLPSLAPSCVLTELPWVLPPLPPLILM